MKRLIVSTGIAMAGLMVLSSTAQATTLTCTGSDRQLTVFNVMAGCHMGSSTNPSATTVGLELGGAWTNEGVLTGGDGTNDMLKVNSDGWGPQTNGTFLINSAFWDTYGRGALSFHVGEGNGDPDYWVFELVQGFTGTISVPGTFDLNRFNGGGGGLSNINLWGSGDPVHTTCNTDVSCLAAVPEPASLVLFGTGLAGVATVIRRKSRRA